MPTDLGPCPYLPDRRFAALLAATPPTRIYRAMLDANCRRMGAVVYQPNCTGCSACRQLRIDVDAFAPSRSQRRCRRRNADLELAWSRLRIDDEHRELLARYQRVVHDDASGGHLDDLAATSAVDGGELQARDASGRLLAVSVVDRFEDALSSVYCYFDPDQRRRSLGSFMVMAEIEFCRRQGLRWLYLGYHIEDCGKMRYKAAFRPHQILARTDDDWAWEMSATD